MPSLSATLLLGYIILMFIVCEAIFAPARAELSLPAGQDCFANETTLFHMTSKVGLQAHHTQHSKLFQVRL
jgi:hypothetical protein